MEPSQILNKAKLLLSNDGRKNRRIGARKVESRNEGVRGVWSALHGGLKPI
jgi:hypothetical protein